ncbi:Uncharacterized protein SCF082_LOCUS7499 [Durusdinium trenchii]|uniref:Uncharacterized protein n=1 Tax=Durusdinium trenchii TaxID=1381693 RepID=A0ABP0INB9_9DINO
MIMHWRSFLWLFPLLPTFYCETQSAVFAADGKVHMDDKRGFKPWIRRQDGAAMELEELRENQAPQAVFGDPKVSPALAKAMLSAETHKSSTLAGLQTALVAEQASASTASALLVISEFTFFLMMLYLLNHKDVNVKRLSWSTLHSSVAIFISMLLFMSTKSLWILMAGHTLDGTPAGVALSWTRYVVVWILGPVILLRRGVDDESREAWCSIVQWFTAFCGADAFGELMMTSVFSASVGAQFGGFILCCFIIWLQCFGACWARHFVALAASTDREMKEKWADSWQVAETTYAGYILGLTLSMWTRFATSGIPTGAYGQPPGQTGAHSGLLALWTGTAVLVGFIVIGLVHRLGAPERSWTSRRFSQMTTSIMAMFCAWMSLYTLEWEFLYYTNASGFGGQAADINASILLAICSSVFMFAIMRIIDFIADRTGSPSVRSTAIFCELFIGLTWQRVFYMAIRLSGRQYKQAERVIDVVCMWSLAAICSPAWSFYILPFFLKAKEEEEQEIKSGAKASSEGKESQLADSGTPSKKNDATPAPASEKPKDDDEEF